MVMSLVAKEIVVRRFEVPEEVQQRSILIISAFAAIDVHCRSIFLLLVRQRIASNAIGPDKIGLRSRRRHISRCRIELDHRGQTSGMITGKNRSRPQQPQTL